MEAGQYNSAWRYVHLLPEDVLKAVHDLNAKTILPVHHSKFVLARHAWNEPLEKIVELGKHDSNVVVLTPMIGEPIYVGSKSRGFKKWWK
jgi:L-ascorbate metabolism protein UlaG (beta-lactamase superfamily)